MALFVKIGGENDVFSGNHAVSGAFEFFEVLWEIEETVGNSETVLNAVSFNFD
jgi:hypothetical protein